MENPRAILPAVAAVIFNAAGEILLQKRKDVNQWGIISGHVEFGETVENAILREILEETGLSAEVTRFIGIYSAPASQTYDYPDRTVQYVTSYFEARLTQAFNPDFCNEETSALQFFSTDALPENFARVSPHWLSDALSEEASVFIR